MSKGLRWFVAAAGLFCFFPTYDLLIRPGIPVLVLGMVPMWIIALGAGGLGLVLLASAILGPARTIIFDPVKSEMRDLGAAGFGLRWDGAIDSATSASRRCCPSRTAKARPPTA